MKKKWIVGLGLGLLLPLIGVSAPYGNEGKPVTFKQPNGAVLELRVFGDEFYAVTETLDGCTVVFDPAKKAYYYATLSPDGNTLLSTGQLAGTGTGQPKQSRLNSQSRNIPKHLRINAAKQKELAIERHRVWDESMGISKQWKAAKATRRAMNAAPAAGDVTSTLSESGISMAPPSSTTTGTKVGLTLLIDFPDDPATISRTEIQAFCNSANYTGHGNNGSVMQYFKDVSKNMLTYSNVVTVYIRMNQPKSYYNDTSKSSGTQARLLIGDAINILTNRSDYASSILPTFNNLTLDAENRVVACNVFFAGYDSGVWGRGLWPNAWSLLNPLPLSSGKSVYRYQITNIGESLFLRTFCHENGHMLCGFPDLYDYGYDSVGGADDFCLMGHVVTYPCEFNPPQFCAYLKQEAGWAATVDLTSNSVLTASVSSSGANFNRFYRYAKPGTATEYYLIENRQQAGRDSNLRASGVAIWHIDELGDRDNQSTAYNSSHANYEVSLVQADNQFHFQNNRGSDPMDLFYSGNSTPGYVNRFSDSTAPSARWWDGSPSGIDFRNFSANGTTMTFSVVTGKTTKIAKFYSVAAHDGYVDESSETSNVGGSINSTNKTGSGLRVGDTGSKKQRKAFLSFDTSALPDNAVVTAANLSLKCGAIVGYPDSLGEVIMVDINNSSKGFSGSLSLQTGDFKASASKSGVGSFNCLLIKSNAWSIANLDTNGTSRIAKTNHTQFRISFPWDDDNDSYDDYVGFYPGDASITTNRPFLEILYVDADSGSGAGCHIDTPTGSVTKNLGETLAVAVTASDPDGVERVKIYLNGVEKMSDSSSPYSFNLPLTNAGTFTLIAKVKDVLGNYTTSDNSRTITVNSGTTTTTVPWVTNLTQAAAGTSVTNAGLVVGTVSSAYSSTVAAGKVISQTPGGGTTVNLGSSVNLAVSLGPQSGATVTFTSVAAHDGYVDESSETSNVGGAMSAALSTGTALRVGDTGAKKQRKTFVSFNTASLPDTAVVTKAVLKLKRGGIVGAPTSLGAITVDIKNTSIGFGTKEALEIGDFQAAASKSNVGTLSYPTANDTWAIATLNADGISRINKTDHTQFRVRFTTDDDNDSADDYLGFYSGENATAANRPVLEVTYQ